MKMPDPAAIGKFLCRRWKAILIGIGAHLIGAELILRLFVVATYPAVEVAFDRGNRNCIRPVPGSTKTFHSYGLTSKPVQHHINSLGFRGPEPTAKDGLTIAVVGGSVVFGTGMTDEMTVPQQIEAVLKADNPGLAVHVLNLGFPDFNIEEQSFEFQGLAPKIKPDIVLILASDRSYRAPLCTRAALPVRESLQKLSALARFLEIKNSGNALTDVQHTFALPQTPLILGVILQRFQESSPDATMILATLTQMHLSENRFQSGQGQGGKEVAPGQFCSEIGFTFADLSAPAVNKAGHRLRSLYSEEDLTPETVTATAQRLVEILKPVIKSRTGAETKADTEPDSTNEQAP